MALFQIAEPGLSAAPHEHRLAVGIDLGTTNSVEPLMTLATKEFVVPRSMPTARRCSCGAAERPGSAI